MQAKHTPINNDFGLEVTVFCVKTGIQKKQIAIACRIPYQTLIHVIKGRRPGHEIVPKVQEYMRIYAVEHENG